MSALVKTCGMWRPEDIEAVNAARPDFVGFVVNFPKSHRSVTPKQCADLRENLRADIETVGVFVDEDPRVIASMIDDCIIDIVQLHGHEDEDYIAQLRELCDAPIFKAFKIRSEADVAAAQSSSAEMVLLDNGYGTGECFDWEQIGDFGRPFILAGGLTPENLGEAIAQLNPWAVDMSSSLETDKKKDPAKIAAAVDAVRNCK